MKRTTDAHELNVVLSFVSNGDGDGILLAVDDGFNLLGSLRLRSVIGREGGEGTR